jgi:cytochrome c oxidase subunit 3
MTQVATQHSEHETSLWPLLTGVGVLLIALALLAFFEWQMPMLGIVLSGGVIEEGLGSVAVAVFIVSEVMIFGTMFAAFWMGRIDNADQWASYIPTDLDRTFAIWLTLILWASSITIVLSQRAFERDNRGSAQFWLVATFALGLLCCT